MNEELDIVEAGLALLRSHPHLTVFPDANGNIDQNADPPYVVVHSNVDYPKNGIANTLTGSSDCVQAYWYCHSVGATRDAALAVSNMVRLSLLNKWITVSGFNSGIIERLAGTAMSEDIDSGTPIFEITSVYSVLLSR